MTPETSDRGGEGPRPKEGGIRGWLGFCGSVIPEKFRNGGSDGR